MSTTKNKKKLKRSRTKKVQYDILNKSYKLSDDIILMPSRDSDDSVMFARISSDDVCTANGLTGKILAHLKSEPDIISIIKKAEKNLALDNAVKSKLTKIIQNLLDQNYIQEMN
ncbi:MAG: hypothetical protein KDD38_07675 [Bdellovibrionales bacterium]|nr:hypothetical protein [Bdellovibrionales bacterium]